MDRYGCRSVLLVIMMMVFKSKYTGYNVMETNKKNEYMQKQIEIQVKYVV